VGTELLTERHAGQIEGVLGYWDRMLIFGALPGRSADTNDADDTDQMFY
jgi:hypothetical protein